MLHYRRRRTSFVQNSRRSFPLLNATTCDVKNAKFPSPTRSISLEPLCRQHGTPPEILVEARTTREIPTANGYIQKHNRFARLWSYFRQKTILVVIFTACGGRHLLASYGVHRLLSRERRPTCEIAAVSVLIRNFHFGTLLAQT